VRVQRWCPFTIQISANGHECEALRSDGTPHVVVRDADIETGRLLRTDGTPRLPILVSLAAEAVDDGAVEQLRAYVAAGGFLVVGSSTFTRRPDGTTRTDFALAPEMGLHVRARGLESWARGATFEKLEAHRLTAAGLFRRCRGVELTAMADEAILAS